MGMEGFSPSQSELITPSLADRLRVGLEKPVIAGAEAIDRRFHVGEGSELINMARMGADHEEGLENRATRAESASRTAGQRGLEARRIMHEAWEEQNERSRRRDRLEQASLRAAAKGNLGEMTPEDAALINGQLNLPETNVPTPDQVRGLLTEAIAQREAAARDREIIIKNRGELPNVPLSKDRQLAVEAEFAQQDQMEAGLAILHALEIPGSEHGHTLDDLQRANIEGLRFSRAEATRTRKLNRLSDRLVARYPDRADAITQETSRIFEELTTKREGLNPVENAEMPDEARTDKATELTEVVGKRFKTKESGDAFLAEIGVGKDEEGNLTIVEGSLSDRRMQAEARCNALNEAYLNAMERAREDPRLADKALELAIRRHQAMAERGVLFNELIARDAAARAEEQAVLQRERAQKQKDALAEQRAQQRAEAVAAARSVAEKAWKTPLRLFGRLMEKAGLFGQALERLTGKKQEKQQTKEDQLRAEIEAAKARLEQLTAQLEGTTEAKKVEEPAAEQASAEEDFDLFADEEYGAVEGQSTTTEKKDGEPVAQEENAFDNLFSDESVDTAQAASVEVPQQPVVETVPVRDWESIVPPSPKRSATVSRTFDPNDPNLVSLGGE